MTDEDKCELIAKLISTEEGRKMIIDIAMKSNTMDKLYDAIIKCFENFLK